MSGYICNLCEDATSPVVQLHVNLTNGQTAAICLNCMPAALIGALAGELGIDAQRLYDNIRRFAEREAKSAAKAQAQAATSDPETIEDEPEIPEHDPGPEVDDEGGMSEYRNQLPDTESETIT